MSINQCTFIGNVTRRPQMRRTRDGGLCLRFSIAINEKAYDRQTKTWDKMVTYIDLVAFDDIANELSAMLHIGTQIAVDCYLRMLPCVIQNPDGKDIHYQRPEFFVTRAEIGQQPRRVHDSEWWSELPGTEVPSFHSFF